MAEWITLENKALKVVIDPAQGAGILAFEVKKKGRSLSLMPDTRDRTCDLKAACFLMLPYSNRIENGIFSFNGRTYRLANAENHAIHGDTRFRAWIVEEASSTRIRCRFVSSKQPDVNWPWPFEACVDYEISKNVFTSKIVLWNRGESTMPAGFGWHPYFNRMPTGKNEPVYLCFKTQGVYPDAHNSRIPSGPAQRLSPEQDFSKEKRLHPDAFIDACCQGYDGNGYILWSESGIRLVFDCSPECTHLIMYNPARDYFAVEPVTNANNGVNLFAQGNSTSGVVSLLPGESLDATFRMTIEG